MRMPALKAIITPLLRHFEKCEQPTKLLLDPARQTMYQTGIDLQACGKGSLPVSA